MSVHLWLRAEHRDGDGRVGLTPQGAASLVGQGIRVTVEESPARAIGIDLYRTAGVDIVPAGTWRDAPEDAFVFGLKELPADGTPLRHRHIMFAHALKAQPGAEALLRRFRDGGGALYDLEYLTGEDGKRLAAFGYWAGYTGAAVALMAWAAQQKGGHCGPVGVHDSAYDLQVAVRETLAGAGASRPNALIVGARGRTGEGAVDFCAAMGVTYTAWDLAETAHGGPFPEILHHHIFLNCILARPGAPVFVPAEATGQVRALSVIGDIACDPAADYSPIRVNDRTTSWEAPARRVHDRPPLDVIAIDNLPTLLPVEASEAFAAQLLPCLRQLDAPDRGPWGRARAVYDRAIEAL